MENDRRCGLYAEAFGVPVVYVNSRGSLEYMPGKMGTMMKQHGFRMNGLSKIYALHTAPIETGIPEAVGAELELTPQKRNAEIRFHGRDILPGNRLFKHLILKPDTKAGLRSYEANHGTVRGSHEPDPIWEENQMFQDGREKQLKTPEATCERR